MTTDFSVKSGKLCYESTAPSSTIWLKFGLNNPFGLHLSKYTKSNITGLCSLSDSYTINRLTWFLDLPIEKAASRKLLLSAAKYVRF